MAIWHSGAPVNCGPECTIFQNTKTLTISRLGTPNAVTLYDDGVVHAKWNGDRLVVTYESACFDGPCTTTQTLSIQDGKLKVVDSFSVAGVAQGAVGTLTYVKG